MSETAKSKVVSSPPSSNVPQGDGAPQAGAAGTGPSVQRPGAAQPQSRGTGQSPSAPAPPARPQPQPQPQPGPAAVQGRPPVAPPAKPYKPVAKKWEPARTRIPVQFRGNLYITGLKATGKSGFALKADHPENVALLDWEGKGKAYADMLGLGLYVDMFEKAAEYAESVLTIRNDHHYKAIIDVAKQIADDPKYTVVVFDTADRLQRSYDAELRANFTKYNIDPNRLGKGHGGGAYGGIWPEVSDQIGNLFAFLKNYCGVRIIGVVEHLAQRWDDGAPVPDKYKLVGAKVFFKLSTLQLITTEDKPGAIAALVKAENVPLTNPETLKITRCLPARLPVLSWESIYSYIESPADLDNPKDGEVWSAEEVAMYGDKLTKDQKEGLKLSLEAMIARSKMGEGVGE